MSVESGEWAEVHDDSAFGDNDVTEGASHEGEVVEGEVIPFQGAASVDLDTVPPLNYEEAQALTENIRATADVLYVLIQRAHAGKAWEPLGYTSFESYVREEFDISRSRAYQLLNQANMIQQIESAAPEGTRVNINEATVRDLKGMMDTLLPSISEATDGMSPDEASSMIDSMLGEARDEIRAEGESYNEELAGDRADRDGFSGGGDYGGGQGGGDYGGGQNGPVDSSSPDDFESELEMPELFGFDSASDPTETRQRLESVYNLYSTLSALQGMLPAEQLVDFIPEERRVQVGASIGPALKWLTEFERVWKSQDWAGQSDEVGDEGAPSDAEDFASQVDDDSDDSDGSTDVFADIR